jgi:hypothetical protein
MSAKKNVDDQMSAIFQEFSSKPHDDPKKKLIQISRRSKISQQNKKALILSSVRTQGNAKYDLRALWQWRQIFCHRMPRHFHARQRLENGHHDEKEDDRPTARRKHSAGSIGRADVPGV